jgi:hypothetical protein
MKTKASLECDRLRNENDVLGLALTDLSNGSVKWFGHSREYSIGVSRPTSASGGVLIVRSCGVTSAHYFERHAQDTLAQISACLTGENTPYNLDLLRRRQLIEDAQAFVRAEQNKL